MKLPAGTIDGKPERKPKSTLIKRFPCPRHQGRHEILVYASDVEKSSPQRGEARAIFVRVH